MHIFQYNRILSNVHILRKKSTATLFIKELKHYFVPLCCILYNHTQCPESYVGIDILYCVYKLMYFYRSHSGCQNQPLLTFALLSPDIFRSLSRSIMRRHVCNSTITSRYGWFQLVYVDIDIMIEMLYNYKDQ